jgi:hypothetical protein
MERVWNGLLTCDYEHTRSHATVLEWDLYTRSLINWPGTLMDEPTPYGRLRRPGIVDIPEADHSRLVAQWHTRLADPQQVALLIALTDQHKRQTVRALDAAGKALSVSDIAAATLAVAEATSAFLDTNATHIVNWLLPEQQWEDQLTRLFGDPVKARCCLSALMTPDAPGHLLRAQTQLLTAATHLNTDLGAAIETQRVAAAFAETVGPVYGRRSPAVTATAMENPAHVTDVLRSTRNTSNAGAELETITRARDRAVALRNSWRCAAVLAAAGDEQALHAVRAIIPACQWAAGSEERRKELRHRYLATVRRWCTSTGADPAAITTDDLLTQGTKR